MIGFRFDLMGLVYDIDVCGSGSMKVDCVNVCFWI